MPSQVPSSSSTNTSRLPCPATVSAAVTSSVVVGLNEKVYSGPLSSQVVHESYVSSASVLPAPPLFEFRLSPQEIVSAATHSWAQLLLPRQSLSAQSVSPSWSSSRPLLQSSSS